MNSPEHTDSKTIFTRVTTGMDIFGRNECHRVDKNLDVPGYLQRNRERFRYALNRDAEDGNFVDFWEVLDERDKKL